MIRFTISSPFFCQMIKRFHFIPKIEIREIGFVVPRGLQQGVKKSSGLYFHICAQEKVKIGQLMFNA